MLGLGLTLALAAQQVASGPAQPVTSINAEGWSAEYSVLPTMETSEVVLTRAGYDATGTATTYEESLICTRKKRQVYPNQTSDTASTVALSDYVYSTDSGVTNNSAVASPKPVAAWVTPDCQLVGNTLTGEIIAFHRNARSGRHVPAVIVRATDGTTTVTATVSATTISARTGDKCPLIVYAWSIDITSLNTGLITVNAKVFPWIGEAASVLDSADQSAAREFSPRYYLKNVSRAAAPPLAYVSASGNDSTGVWSTTAATAAATPFLTVQGATNAYNDATRGTPATGNLMDGCRIRIGSGTFVLTGSASTRTQNIAAMIIERDPAVAVADAIVSFGAAAYRPRLGVSTMTAPLTEGVLMFRDVSVLRTGTLTFMGEAATQLRVLFDDDVKFDNASNNASIQNNSHVYIFGMTVTNSAASLFGTSGVLQNRIIRGLSINKNGSGMEQWVTLASSITGLAAPSVADPTKGGIVFCNKFLSPNAATSPTTISATNEGDTITGFVVGQNLYEITHTTSSSPGVRVSSDSPQFGNTVHCMIFNNTVTGYSGLGRYNIFYDTSTAVRTHSLMMHKGDIIVQLNNKGDVFITDGTHVGNFAYTHGVGCQGNFTQFRVASTATEQQTYPGFGSNIATSETVRNDPLFTDYQGTGGAGGTPSAGSGGGTYTLQAGSPCLGIVTTALLSHTLNGVARSASNDNAGAFAAA